MATGRKVTFQRNRFSHIVLVPLAFGVPILLLAPFFAGTYTLALFCIYALLAVSLGLIWGFGGILCFGQGAFFGIGAYAYVIIVTNVGMPWFSLLLAVIFSVIVIAVFGAAMFYGRLGDVYLAVVTLVFTLILNRFMNSTAGPEYYIGSARLGGFNGIPGFPTLDYPWGNLSYLPDAVFYTVSGVFLVVAWMFCRWLLQSHFGRVIVAIRENEQRVEFAGYDVRLYKTAIFAIGGGLAALAGVLYANWAGIVTPALFNLNQSAEIIIWTIVGGLGTLLGPMIGSTVLVALTIGLGYQSAIDNFFLMGVLLIIVVLVFPKGIAGAFIHSRFSRLSDRQGRWNTRSNRHRVDNSSLKTSSQENLDGR